MTACEEGTRKHCGALAYVGMNGKTLRPAILIDVAEIA